MSAPEPRRLATSYARARADVLHAADHADTTLTSFPHEQVGLDGEELAVDVIGLGSADADAVVVVVSGTHGVEGYAGSALQRWFLEERAESLPDDVRVVMIHALNPVGFSWVRRVNEDNVDLNRNFVDWTSPAPTDTGYGELADLLVPQDWSPENREATTSQLVDRASEIGIDRFQQVVSGGQYDHPSGIFYGGAGPTWSHRWIARHLPEIVGPADRVCVIDLHTGLGPWGHGELITIDPVDSAEYERETAWWGDDVRSMYDGESVSAELSGDWLTAVADWLPDAEVTTIAVEYGTVDVFTVLQALRADAWLHAHGDPAGPDADEIRDQVRAAFADDDPEWLSALVERFDSVCMTAVSALRG